MNEDTIATIGTNVSRSYLPASVGRYVRREDKIYRITEIINYNLLVGTNVETDRSEILEINELKPIDENLLISKKDLSEFSDTDWAEAETRFAIIQPLIKRSVIGRYDVNIIAQENNINTATVYRWLKQYRATGSILSLISRQRGWKTGNKRIHNNIESIINEVIEQFYLTPQRQTAQKAVLEVKRICNERKIVAPSDNTIRARLAEIPERIHLRGRGYKEKAKNSFLPAAGSFPNADYPLAVVQIDHTPADIILVDDTHRKPIGRPWITVAMDVYSRMITGYYLSFDSPSETSIAMCVSHSILPKQEWLLLHKVDAEWPVWGIPNTIHVDNGADFRSDNFRRSCQAYGINLEFRPVKQPRYGGHIERVLGSILKEIHTLPGTTFSSVKEKENYNSEKFAALTKNEFESWLVNFICKIYHQREHKGIKKSPTKQWELGIFGTREVPGIGLPPRPTNPTTLLNDFLPMFTRTVQTFGVTIDNLSYYSEALRPWINAKDPDDPKKKRQLIFRRDPRDISSIWFKDPLLNQYFKIPLADQSLPAMSAWEYNQVQDKLKKEGSKSVNNSQILYAITELRDKVEASKAKTKKARRQAQRRVEHEKNISPAISSSKILETSPIVPSPQFENTGLIDDEIQAIGEIE